MVLENWSVWGKKPKHTSVDLAALEGELTNFWSETQNYIPECVINKCICVYIYMCVCVCVCVCV